MFRVARIEKGRTLSDTALEKRPGAEAPGFTRAVNQKLWRRPSSTPVDFCPASSVGADATA